LDFYFASDCRGWPTRGEETEFKMTRPPTLSCSCVRSL
jgi:hypothetical protein